MQKIEITSNRAGDRRIVIWDGIEAMSNVNRYANITWIVRHVDEEGNPIQDLDLNQDRRVITPISDYNLVTDQGIVITPDQFETPEAYQEAYDAGIPEYTFWMAMIEQTPLPEVISLAAQMLAQFNRFDRS
jgi:hypothetical protein